jgi:hypothetical protein
MRQADFDEVYEFSDSPIGAILSGWWYATECYVIDVDGHPSAIFGRRGREVWMVACERIFSISRLLARESRRWVQALAEGSCRLGNYVDSRNLAHIRWIEWCGFTFTGHETYSPRNDITFYEFELTPAHV